MEPTTPTPEREHASRDQLRAMAHPLRLEIMERVGRRGTARAADIAADLGIPANSVSYHLRTLARGGVIEEAPDAARDRRDRVWRLAQTSFRHGPGADPSTPDAQEVEEGEDGYREAAAATSVAAFEWMRAAWAAELARTRRPGSCAEDGLGSMVMTSVRLSRAQMAELEGLVAERIQEYQKLNRDDRGADRPGDPDSDGEARTYTVLWAAVGDPASRDGSPRPDADQSSGTASPSSSA